MRGKVSKRAVDDLGPSTVLWDSEVTGFAARKLASGRVSYGLKYTDAATGRQRWLALGLHGDITPDQARKRAIIERGRIAAGADPQAERQAVRVGRAEIVCVDDLLDAHLRLYVHARQLRSERQISRSFDKYVRPAIGRTRIRDLKRSHIVSLLDSIASRNAPVMADRVLAYLRKALNWYAARDDEFVVPIVRGMGHTNPKERARDRILSDNEIRALWDATEPAASDPYRILVRLLLLTGQRRQEVAGMRWSEIDGDLWTVPGERMKRRRDHLVVLSDTALSLLGTLPGLGDFVFGRAGITPFSGFSKSKAMLDDRMQKAFGSAAAAPQSRPWTHHDLRRTARSLMARAGVRPDIAERVLNHALSGMQAVYDRYDYAPEQRLALVALEQVVLKILGSGSPTWPTVRPAAPTVRPAARVLPSMVSMVSSPANVSH